MAYDIIMNFDFDNVGLFSVRRCPYCMYKKYEENILYQYQNPWDGLSSRKEKLTSYCVQCYWDMYCYINDNLGCKEFFQKNGNVLVSDIEGVLTNHRWKFIMHPRLQLIFGKLLLCLLNLNICKTENSIILQKSSGSSASSSVVSVADKSTNCSFTANEVRSLLQNVLSALSEYDICIVFNNYLEQMYAMKSEITEEVFCFLVAQIEKLVDGEKIKLKLISWKILHSLFNLYHQESPNYPDHTKILRTNLLADILIKFSTNQIDEAFYLYLEKSCVSDPNIMLELVKTFLDISINPKISKHKKSIIEGKIKPIFISHDKCKTALPPTTELTDSTEKKMDHKRIIDICISVVKTESKFDINIPKYENIFWTEKKAIEIEVEMIKRSQETETLVLLMLLLITITSTGHHKSAKLKKYLSLKYEYATASLYLLWCSGDIEVHPGPSLNKKTLANDSAIQRRWIQNISPKILVLLREHEQSKSNPTKKVRHERENREYFKALLKKCEEEKVNVPKMYLAEINAWETMKYKLLHKLFVYRCEFETIITSLKDFLTYGGRNSDLTNINVSLITDLKTNEIATDLGKDQRPTKQSQLIVYIIRFIAGISIKCAHGKNTDAKCDGLWDQPLENWPTDIILFDPNNRGKYSKKSPGKLTSDQELVDILTDLPQVTIPQKYTEIVDAYKLMRKSHTKQHKLELCSTFKRIVSLEKLDFALKNLSETRILTYEIHEILTKWWTTGAVETGDDQTQSLKNMDDAKKKERPHISINISTKSITLTVEPSSPNSSQVSYDFPFKDELVPLTTMATSVSQTTIQKPLSDSYQKVTAKTYLTVSPKPDADNQTTSNSITIPTEAMAVLNKYFPCELYPNSQAILESPTLCSLNQSCINSDDISSATKDSHNLDFNKQVSPTSDMGSSDSKSSVNSESRNDKVDQNIISNGSQVLLINSDYSSDSSCNYLSTNMKKRKCTEEEKKEMNKRRKTSPKQDKEQTETNHQKTSVATSTILDKNTDFFMEEFNIDVDSFELNDSYLYDDKNQHNSDKAGSLMKYCSQISYENTNASANYKTEFSTELDKFLQDMINGDGKKMSQMNSYLSDV